MVNGQYTVTAIPYWRLSGFYFFYFATLGALAPYWNLFLSDAGYTALEIGQLSALLIGTKLLAPNLGGWLADRIGKSLVIIRWALFMATLLFTGFFFFQGYLWFALITAGYSFFWNAALPQFEAATLFHLREQSHRYSRIRLWGSMGFIATVLGVGRLLDVYPIAWLSVVIGGFLAGNWLVALMVPEAPPRHPNPAPVAIWKIIKQPAVVAFFVVALLLQAAHAPYYAFYSIYLKDHGYSATVTGGFWALGVVAEIVLFVYMKPLLARCSLRAVLLASIFLAVCRWLMIAWGAGNLAVLLSAQVLHAATFGSTHVAAIHLLQGYFGQQHQGKGQALYGSVCLGLGGMLGSLLCGYYWELLGAHRIYSICAAVCCLAGLWAWLWVGRENGSQAAAFS